MREVPQKNTMGGMSSTIQPSWLKLPGKAPQSHSTRAMVSSASETMVLSRKAKRDTAAASCSSSATTVASSYLQVERMMNTSM